MNIFVASCGRSSAELEPAIVRGLEWAAAPFPTLAGERPRLHQSNAGRIVLATIAPPAEVAAPRIYTASDDRGVITYDGRPLTASGRALYRASELARCCDSSQSELEGAFALVRLELLDEILEIVTDPLGNLAIYSTTLPDGTRLVGNSLAAIAKVANASSLDATGVATFFALGWFGERRTPLLDVSVLEGGSRFTYDGEASVAEHRYFSPEQLLLDDDPPTLEELTHNLLGLVRSATVDGGVSLGLTAGRDSRVCLALALQAGIDIHAYTEGRPGMFDVDAAREVAERFGVPHSTLEPPEAGQVDAETLIRSFVAVGDCSSSFAQLADHFPQMGKPSRLGIKLVGLGGEAARANTHPVRALLLAGGPLTSTVAAQRALSVRKVALFSGLLNAECGDLASGYIDRWFSSRLDEEFPPRLLAESIYVFDAMVRVHNGSVRRTAGTSDLAFPLSSRPFLRYAWSQPISDRYAEGPHRRLLKCLEPRLLEPPLDHPWPSSAVRSLTVRTALDAARLASRTRAPRGNALALDSALWTSQRHVHRALVESVSDSTVFTLVDRGALLQALESDGTPSAGVLRTLSVFWWLEHVNQAVRSPTPGLAISGG